MPNIRLPATEKGFLWTNYMVDSMAVCCLDYFLAICEDEKIKEILTYALNLSKIHTKICSKIFTKENHPIPIGFTSEDVNLSAPRLFSDEFVLFYLHQLANSGLTYYSKSLAMTVREDVHDFYKECISSSTE